MDSIAGDRLHKTAWICLRVLASLLALGLSTGLFAQHKCVYYGGALWEWDTQQGPGVYCTGYTWDGANLNEGWSDSWGPSAQVLGSAGGCVFQGKLYCFAVTAGDGGTLWYLTMDPQNSHAETGPTKIAAGIGSSTSQSGAVAAVVHDTIYVLVAGQKGFASKDGKSFATWDYTVSADAPQQVLDAVTLLPASDDPASLLLVYNDSGGALRASVFTPPATASTRDLLLPWPSANPYVWKPVVQGNLVLGTSGGYHTFTAGAKAPCIQFYAATAQGQDGYHQGRWEYNVATETWSFNDITVSGATAVEVWPWYETTDPTTFTMRQSHVVSYWVGSGQTNFANLSDWMIPQNNDPSYGWQGTPTPTAGATTSELQGLWTLVGVILGPPPFAMNGASNACPSQVGFSWVDYGKDTSTTVTTTSTASSTVSVAMNNSVKAGFGEFSLDLSYAHGWASSHQSSHAVSVSEDFQFGPCSEQAGSQGTHGWVIFNAPTLVTQWYKLYAYDKETYLDEDIYATALGDTVQQFTYFELADPSQGGYPGLFAGMATYPNSTDVTAWSGYNWDDGGSDWTVTFGAQTDPQMPTVSEGGRDEVTYTQTDTTISSNGNSNSFGVQAGGGVHFAGFSSGITVGYDGEWTTNTQIQSTITQDVTCALNMQAPPSPCPSGDVCDLVVQPYWLQASSAKAPWIPTGYAGDLPWCITWHAIGATVGGATVGVAGPPSSAAGTIRHGGDKAKDSYSLEGGRMAWMNADGSETPVPLTADQFDPSIGASVSLSGHVFSADGSSGKWVRKGEVWKYQTREGVKKDTFSLMLNCAEGTWSFDGSSKTLDDEIQPADGIVRVRLGLQSSYVLANWIKNDVDTTWSHSEKQSGWQAYGVHELEGSYASRTSVGNLKLKGHIPKNIGSFGDVEIRINGTPVQFPLLATEGFLKHLKNGGTSSYKAEGLTFDVDFGSGMWKATVGTGQFKRGMAPKGGAMRVQVRVGGTQISDQEVQLQKCITELRFAG